MRGGEWAATTEAYFCCCLSFFMINPPFIWVICQRSIKWSRWCVFDCFTVGPWAAVKRSSKPHNLNQGIYMPLWMNISLRCCLTHCSAMQPASLCVCHMLCQFALEARLSCLPWYAKPAEVCVVSMGWYQALEADTEPVIIFCISFWPL